MSNEPLIYKVLGWHKEYEEWEELFGISGTTPEIALAKARRDLSPKYARIYSELKVELSQDNKGV